MEENDFIEKMVEQSHVVDEHFGVKSLNFLEKSKKNKENLDSPSYVKRPAYLCEDVPSFVSFVMEKRDLEPDNCKMLVTADGGGGFFTVGLSVIDHNA